LGYFLSKWITFENAVQKKAEKTPAIKPKALLGFGTEHLLHVLEVPDEMRYQVRRIKALRNLAVHGAERIDESELIEAGKLLEQMLQQLHEKFPD
jgi:hypothetical protein